MEDLDWCTTMEEELTESSFADGAKEWSVRQERFHNVSIDVVMFNLFS